MVRKVGKKEPSKLMDTMDIGTFVKLQKDTLEWQFLANTCQSQWEKIYLKRNILMKAECWQWSLKSFIWWQLMFQTVVKNWTDSNTESKTGTHVSKLTWKSLEKRRRPYYAETWTFAINRLISPDQKEMKELQGLPLSKGRVSLSFWKTVGLILLDTFTLKPSNIHGGAWGQEEGRKTLVGDWITFW